MERVVEDALPGGAAHDHPTTPATPRPTCRASAAQSGRALARVAVHLSGRRGRRRGHHLRHPQAGTGGQPEPALRRTPTPQWREASGQRVRPRQAACSSGRPLRRRRFCHGWIEAPIAASPQPACLPELPPREDCPHPAPQHTWGGVERAASSLPAPRSPAARGRRCPQRGGPSRPGKSPARAPSRGHRPPPARASPPRGGRVPACHRADSASLHPARATPTPVRDPAAGAWRPPSTLRPRAAWARSAVACHLRTAHGQDRTRSFSSFYPLASPRVPGGWPMPAGTVAVVGTFMVSGRWWERRHHALSRSFDRSAARLGMPTSVRSDAHRVAR